MYYIGYLLFILVCFGLPNIYNKTTTTTEMYRESTALYEISKYYIVPSFWRKKKEKKKRKEKKQTCTALSKSHS